MLVAILILLNIPVYLAIGWLVFDTKDRAVDTFYETIVAVLKAIFIPRIVRILMEDDDEGSWGLLPIAAFFGACIAITYAEYHLITTYLL